MDSGEYRRTDSLAFWRMYDIPHYYGDYVRQIFLAAAVLSVVAIPLLGDLLPFGTLAQVGAAAALVLLAALTHPHGRIVLLIDALIAGVGFLFLQSAAVSFYNTEPFMLFVAREGVALMLLFAFYFSVKTVRAMGRGLVGHPYKVGEFDEKN